MSEPTALEQIAAANEQKAQYLRQNGVAVPSDQMYATSLLEYLLLDVLDDARLYHEERIAPILDRSIAGLQALAERAQTAQAEAAEEQARAQREAVLLGRRG